MSIKGERQARLTALHIRLQALESVFGYEERPLHRAVITSKIVRHVGSDQRFGLGSGSSASARRLWVRSFWRHVEVNNVDTRIKSQSGRHRRSRRVRLLGNLFAFLLWKR